MTNVEGVGSDGQPQAADPWNPPAAPPEPPEPPLSGAAPGFGWGLAFDDHFPSEALLEPHERHDLTEHLSGDYQVSTAEHTALEAERGLAATAEQTGRLHSPADARIAELENSEQHTAARTVADTQAVDHWDQAHPGVHAAAQGVHDMGLDPVVQVGEDVIAYGEHLVETFAPPDQPDGG